jgi:long-chain acyl-CoA synthetase
VELRIGDEDELLTRSPSVMQGYWKDPVATCAAIDGEGWLHTGDRARIDAQGHVFITGRIKDILVLTNGEKLPPADMEMAIQLDPLFDQVMVLGEGRPFLTALVVLNPEAWDRFARERGLDPGMLEGRSVERALLERVQARLSGFPGYARIRRLAALDAPWTIDEDLITPTMKMKRARVAERHAAQIEALYAKL